MRLVLTSLMITALPLAFAAGTESLRQNAPFGATTPAAAVTQGNGLATLELVGIVELGKEPRFGLRDIATNQSYWVTLNQEQNGITVIAFDSKHQTATVQGRGATRLLVLKSETITPATPAPNAVPPNSPMQPRPGSSAVATAAPRPVPQPEPMPANLTPEQIKTRQAETEARMLVSDLMEISMQERARYAEEQRRRAAGQSAPAPAPAPGSGSTNPQK